MGPIVLGWVFAGFIYFKVAFQAGTNAGISILASLLIAAILGLTVFLHQASMRRNYCLTIGSPDA
ncbi:hypothetical protein C3731_04945 [Brucella oryzae]|uniref:Uncharacterized protein n=1 Tax=Brucella oryzae TaxID=335286 RepID=A0A2S7J3X0_9HYPH|nr:hypothetical protein C3731_04945 [Brucella oryzae]